MKIKAIIIIKFKRFEKEIKNQTVLKKERKEHGGNERKSE